MTGGHVVVLGTTGRNFGAGMCGGFAYVLDEHGDFPDRVNHERVTLESLTDEDETLIQRLVRRHYQYTRSTRADDVLRKWNDYAPKFVKVFPKDLAVALADRLSSHTGDGELARRATDGESNWIPGARTQGYALSRRLRAHQGLRASANRLHDRRSEDPGIPLHGLRHPVLQQRLSAREHHSRLE
jgi:glutamate synthase domain-containing protein 3